VAICKTCGRKYSKWTSPVGAKGVCPECFESDLKRERETEATELALARNNTSGEKVDEPAKPQPLIFLACALIVTAGLILLLFAGFIATAFHSPLLSTLRGIEWFTMLLANLVVVSYSFPAFTRTKDRAFLCIAFAALIFAYGALFTLLLGSGASATRWRVSHLQAHWYYTTRYVTGIIGFVLYAYGIASLARRTKQVSSQKARPVAT
jgi:hypothetical protein